MLRNIYNVDNKRFPKFIGNKAFLIQRACETLGMHQTIPYQFKEFKTVRNLRKSCIYHKLKENGAKFGQKYGWERPN